MSNYYEVTVWGFEGDIVELHWQMNAEEAEEVQARYEDDPRFEVQIEDRS